MIFVYVKKMSKNMATFWTEGILQALLLIIMNQLKRINPLATVVMHTAHQIPSTPMPIRTNRIASGIRIIVANDADNGRGDCASDAVEYSLHGDFEHHKKLRISVDTEEHTSGFVGRLFGDEYGENFIPEENE